MTVQIFLHDGAIITADIMDYNATHIADKLNDPKILMVAIGDFIINKQSIRLIAPKE